MQLSVVRALTAILLFAHLVFPARAESDFPSRTVSEGKIRVLAVAGPKRDPNVPQAPTLAESGLPGFESNTWFALVTASNVPPDVSKKIRTDVGEAMRSPAVLKRINDIKSIPIGNTSEEFRKIILSDFDIFGGIIAKAK